MTPDHLVWQPSAALPCVCLVRGEGAAAAVVDRTFPPDPAVAASARAFAQDTFVARGHAGIEAADWLVVEQPAAARAAGELLRVTADGTRVRGPGQLHLGVGVAAGLVRCEGAILRDRLGVPLLPGSRLPRAWMGPALLMPGVAAENVGLGDEALAVAAAALGLGGERGSPFDAAFDAVAMLEGTGRGDPLALALSEAVLQALGVALGGLINLFDLPTIVLHAPSPLMTWLGLHAGVATPIQASRLGPVVQRHAFPSLAADVHLCAASGDPDGIALGTVALHRGWVA